MDDNQNFLFIRLKNFPITPPKNPKQNKSKTNKKWTKTKQMKWKQEWTKSNQTKKQQINI